MDVIHITDWMKQQEDAQNVSRSTTISSKALNTDFTMVLRDIRLSDAQNYSLHLKLHGVENSSLVCTVCLTVAGKKMEPEWVNLLTFIMMFALELDFKESLYLKF